MAASVIEMSIATDLPVIQTDMLLVLVVAPRFPDFAQDYGVTSRALTNLQCITELVN